MSRDHETVYPDDPSWPYFWLPKGIEAALLAQCERQRVTYDQLLAEKLTHFTDDADYRSLMSEFAFEDASWPDDLGDCLGVANLRARRYHDQAEATLLKMSPEGLTTVEEEAIRCGLGYDELAAKFIIERLRRLNGEAGPNRDEDVNERDMADWWKDDSLEET